jgi:hypothetical protein
MSSNHVYIEHVVPFGSPGHAAVQHHADEAQRAGVPDSEIQKILDKCDPYDVSSTTTALWHATGDCDDD